MKKLHPLLSILSFAMILLSCHEEGKQTAEYYRASRVSLTNYRIPDWYRDAKLGIFIHWGPYCVPEYGSEWYPRLMYMDDQVIRFDGAVASDEPSNIYQHHVKYWGTPDKFGYKDFIPLFTGDRFDPDRWMQIVKEAGAKYVVAVAEHSDGFAMYQSSHTRWNSVNMGPKRDILKDLAAAAQNHGLKFGASTHFAFNWNYYVHKEGYDTMDPEYFDLYGRPNGKVQSPDQQFVEQWWNRTKEIVDKYPLDILWFDFFWQDKAFAPYHTKAAAYYYNSGLKNNREVVMHCKNNMKDIFLPGTVVLDIERGKSADIRKDPWQTDTSLGKKSWGYVKNWDSKPVGSLIDNLVDIVSKNGNLLLNVGPQKDGTIPTAQVEMLLEIGIWLKTNGEAIYGTRPWKVFGEGNGKEFDMSALETGTMYTSKDIRFTTKDDKLYAILLDWPEDGQVEIFSFGSSKGILEREVKNVRLLGYENSLDWNVGAESLTISVPNRQPTPFAHAFEIAFK